MNSAIRKAVEACGSQSELARRMNDGTKQGHVWYWLKTGRVPAERCSAIEVATEHQVTRKELRPDVFGDIEQSATPSEAEAG